MEVAFVQCGRVPIVSATITANSSTSSSVKFCWRSSSVLNFLRNFDGNYDALRTARVQNCTTAKEGPTNKGTVMPRKRKSRKLHRAWTTSWAAPSPREPKNFEAVDRVDLNRNPALTDVGVESSTPVDDPEGHGRGDLLKTALQCQHFQTCSGCAREWRLDQPFILKEAKKFFNDHGVHDFTFISGNLWEWRCRAKLAVRGTPENVQIGLYQEGTHNVVDIPSCRAHHPNINAAVELLKEAIRNMNVLPYDEVLGRGDLRYVQMAVTTYDTSLPLAERYSNGKVQVALVWNSRSEESSTAEKLFSLSEFLWRRGGSNSEKHIIHSIWANFQTSHSNIIFGARWRHLVGEREFWERVEGVDICLEPASFGQANTQAFDSMLRKLCKYVKHGMSVVELYAGVGVIGLCLAASRKCRLVKCVEINKGSKSSFERSLARLSKSLDCTISWHCADVSETPIHWLEGSDVVVVDPPRRGLDASLIDALRTSSFRGQKSVGVPHRVEKRPWIVRAQQPSIQIQSKTDWDANVSWPETLIYVSCCWESFQQDCSALLANKAWLLENAHAFNFFPGTDSVEILAIFKRGQQMKQKKKKSSKKRILKQKRILRIS